MPTEETEAEVTDDGTGVKVIKKEELEGDRKGGSDLASNMATYLNLTSEFDADTIINIVGSKLFDNFSIFELMMHKAKLNADFGAMDSVLHDTEVILGELKILIEGCMRPLKGSKKWDEVEDEDGVKRKRRRKAGESIELDSMLAMALCLDAGVWKKRDTDEIDYYSPILNVESLFPAGAADIIPAGVTSSASPTKADVGQSSGSGGQKKRRGRRTKKDKEEADKENEEDKKKDGDEKEDEDKKGDEAENKKKRGRKPGRPPKLQSEKTIKTEGGTNDDENGENYVCVKCGQTLCKAYGKQHEAKCKGMFVRHPEYKKVDDEFFCTVEGCNIGYGFNCLYAVRKHFHDNHIREEEKYFACDYCDEKFSFRTNRNKHVHAKHIKRFVCDVCGKGFGGKDKLASHRFTHTGEKPFQCDKCEYRTAKKYNLEMHRQSKHNDFDQKNFLCAICNKQFVTMGRVRRHMEMMHADGKDGTTGSGSKKKRRGAVPPPVPAVVEAEETALTTTHIIQTVPETTQVVHTVEEQDGTTVQYLQNQIEGNPHETVITVTPLYN